MATMFLILTLGLMSLDVGCCYPNFVPTSSCDSMFPQHGASAQNSTPPYALSVSAGCYIPGQPLTVTLSGAGTSSYFRGYLITARLAVNNADAPGTFSVANDRDSRTVSCFGRADSAVSHTSSNYRMIKSFQWTPASSLVSTVDIVATVVRSESRFWVGLKASIDHCSMQNDPSTPTKTTATTTTSTTTVSTSTTPSTTVKTTARPGSTTMSTPVQRGQDSNTTSTTTKVTTTTIPVINTPDYDPEEDDESYTADESDSLSYDDSSFSDDDDSSD